MAYNADMEMQDLREKFVPAIENIIDECRISDSLVDKEKFQVYIATVWANAVLDPGRSGLRVADLESLHDFLNEESARMVGRDQTLTACFEFIVSKPGRDSLTRQQVGQRHKDLLFHFARLILQREITE